MNLNHAAIYHCMSRTVDGQPYFQDREKEVLRKMISQVADFSGVEVLTYCVMSNHFHVLVRICPEREVSDAELVRRFKVLYPKPTDFQPATAADIERVLAAGGEAADQVRAQFLARMGDVSQFMKTLKQRFSMWFNKSHDRYGPVWADRFKSVLVEGKGFALQTVAAYIDLNPVRAGLAGDPKDYRFCGYAEAVAGNSERGDAVRFVMGGETPLSQRDAMRSYRQLLFGKGSAPTQGSAISRKDAVRVLEKQDGQLPIADILRCRIRYISESAILGSNEFVQSHLEEWQQKRARKHPSKIHKVSSEHGAFSCINGCRGAAFE